MESEDTGTDARPDDRSQPDGYAALIEAFGKGWEKGDTDWVEQVFTPDAVFLADPFDGGLEGRSAIAGYWRDVPREQAEVSFRVGEIFSVGPWFSTEFRCTFRRRRTGDWMDVRGALFCETDQGLISEMRMYWHRRSSGRG